MANYIDVPVNVTVTFDTDTGKIVEAYVDPDGMPPDAGAVWSRSEQIWDADFGDFAVTAEEFVAGLIAHAVGDDGIEALA